MRRFLVALLGLAVVACGGGGGGSSPPAPPTVDVTGTWVGIWLSAEGDNGRLDLMLTQTDAAVSGSVFLEGSSCFGPASLSGVVSGNVLDGTLDASGARIDVEATITGDQMNNGTYHVVANGGVCTGDTGTFSAGR